GGGGGGSNGGGGGANGSGRGGRSGTGSPAEPCAGAGAPLVAGVVPIARPIDVTPPGEVITIVAPQQRSPPLLPRHVVPAPAPRCVDGASSQCRGARERRGGPRDLLPRDVGRGGQVAGGDPAQGAGGRGARDGEGARAGLRPGARHAPRDRADPPDDRGTRHP